MVTRFQAADTVGALPAEGDATLLRRAITTQPDLVAEIIVRLGHSIGGADELVTYLRVCVETAVEVIGGAHCAGVTVQHGGNRFTAVHTDTRDPGVDAHQHAAGDGPWLHALHTGEVVAVDVATSRVRWPQLTAEAEAAGIRSFLAAPLGDGERGRGAFNLCSHDANGFTPAERDLLLVIVHHASRVLSDHQRLTDAQALSAQLQQAMVSRAPIEQAKGILMAAHQISAGDAFDLLRTRSQNTNTKLHDIAATFIADSSLTPPPGAPLAGAAPA